MSDRDATSAWRRRQRHLRAQWRHEQQTVAMALATVTYHSFQVGTKYAAPRGQMSGTSAGSDVEGLDGLHQLVWAVEAVVGTRHQMAVPSF